MYRVQWRPKKGSDQLCLGQSRGLQRGSDVSPGFYRMQRRSADQRKVQRNLDMRWGIGNIMGTNLADWRNRGRKTLPDASEKECVLFK